MSIRRVIVLMHGLGYELPEEVKAKAVFERDITRPKKQREQRPRESMASKEEMRGFFGGAIRVTPGEEVMNDGG